MPLPDDSSGALERAIALAQQGAWREAEASLVALLARDAGNARAHNVLGVVRMQDGRSLEAEASLLEAVRLAPADARPHLNLGKLYGARPDPERAEKHLREAVRLAPADPAPHFNLGVLLRGRGRLADAEGALRRALDLDPRDVAALVQLGALLHAAGRAADAEPLLVRAIEIAPQEPESHYRLARIRLEASRFREAEAGFREAIRREPGFAAAHADLALVLLETARVAAARSASEAATRAAPDLLRAWSNQAMCAQYDPSLDDGRRLDIARRAGAAISASSARFSLGAPPIAPHAGRDVLDAGIVSGDLHRHPVGLLLLPALRELVRLGHRVTLYSNGSVEDEVTAELRRLGGWRDISKEPDAAAWAALREARHDLVIDLAGHTGNNRLALFAARVAPVQLSWLGYFATTGVPNMDGILMDPWHAPPGSERLFTERLLRMPHTRFCFQPIAGAPEVASRPPSVERGHVTFGSFNSLAKINDDVVRAWARVLHAVPASRLLLKWRTLADPEFRRATAARFGSEGIAPDRLELRGPSSYRDVLGQYAEVDIALDPFPFTGGQTSFDAAWMGVPVVTLAGHTPASRQTLALYGNVGLESHAAPDLDAYVARAAEWASDPAFLADYRRSMRERMRASPLMKAPEFARDLAAVLRQAVAGV